MKTKHTYKAKLEELDTICEDIESFCEKAAVDTNSKFALNLCVDEIYTNIVMYGYKGDESQEVEIELEKVGDEIQTTICDNAPAFDPTTETSAPDISSDIDTRDIGGLGVFFIKKNMDRVSYKRENNKNVLTMAKKIAEK